MINCREESNDVALGKIIRNRYPNGAPEKSTLLLEKMWKSFVFV